MRWCAANGVDVLVGLAKNPRRRRERAAAREQAQQPFTQTREATRVLPQCSCRTHDRGSRQRRVVGKAEHLAKGPQRRFVVSSLRAEAFAGQALYEQDHGGRADRENRIKEQPLLLFANRVRCQTMPAKHVRLCLATMASGLLRALREQGLAGTELAQAQRDTIRVKRLKIGAVIGVSVRRVAVSLSEA
jgi:hypothetical protein